MLYRTMAKTGDALSILGFGCMRLPQKTGQPGTGKIDEERAGRQIRDAIDRGVNYLDTGMLYHMGRSEPFLGRALADGYRGKVKIATKLPPWSARTEDDMEKILSVQLENLRTDCIDYYLLHGVVGESWKKLMDLPCSTSSIRPKRKDASCTQASRSTETETSSKRSSTVTTGSSVRSSTIISTKSARRERQGCGTRHRRASGSS